MAGINRLFIKALGKPITTQSMIGGFHVPNGATTFDYIAGIGKKGKFQRYAFKSADGRMIQSETTFFNAGKKTHQTRTHAHNQENGMFDVIDIKKDANGNVYEASTNGIFPVLNPNNPEKIAFIQAKEFSGTKDLFEYNFLQSGTPKQGIRFETNWDGKKPKLKYTNIDDTLNAKNQNYLPLVFSRLNKTTNNRINLIQALNEKKYKLQGALPPVERVPTGSLDSDYRCLAQFRKDGQISVDESVTNGNSLILILGHEFKHLDDFVQTSLVEDPHNTHKKAMKRVKEWEKSGLTNIRHFYDFLSANKTNIPLDSPSGRFYERLKKNWFNKLENDPLYHKSEKTHDGYWIEKRADHAGMAELNKVQKLAEDLFKFIYSPRKN